jgi:uncharacterized surface protein with fasciclin (FAS1) repeats
MKSMKLSLLLLAFSVLFSNAAELNATTSVNETDPSEIESADHHEEMDLVELAASDERFSTLVELVQAAGLVDVLKSDNFTILAPTNEAFEAVPQETLDALANDVDLLRTVLLTHVISGSVMAETVVGLDEAPTAAGNVLPINVSDSGVQIGNAMVTETDLQASNGVIHVMDAVIMPPEEDNSGGY